MKEGKNAPFSYCPAFNIAMEDLCLLGDPPVVGGA
jgi:hypothetical protein